MTETRRTMRSSLALPTLILATLAGAAAPVRAQAPAAAPPAQAQMQMPALVQSLLDRLRGRTLPDGIVSSNGRIEATQVDIAAKYAGRLEIVTVKEGDEVTAGQVLARITSPEYEAQLRGAQAQVLKAKQALAEAEALIAQRASDLAYAKADLDRGQELVDKGYLSKQVFDQRRNKLDSAEAASRAAQAQRDQAEFAIRASEADVEQVEAILVDLTLVAPRSGRVQYKLAEAGEVVGAGTRILTLLDLNDVYMTLYLPAAQAGKLVLGDEARIILDPVPQYVVPATISFVAADAQFTPKSVETREEREKLMFRVKLQVDPKVLATYHRQVKTGVRGMGFVRTRADADWPADLAVKLP
ncbi:HlyD family secretion protein [Ancylobacter terrae]|uniref:HlyD family secretion protein n=1 Tax=Ancylobacter sp. sgz301288 TaxID=3342077 RepID=UPI00385E4CE5